MVIEGWPYHDDMKRIASLEDIPDTGLKFAYSEGPLEEEGILLKMSDGSVRAYKNQCRHLPMRLDDREPSEFFDPAKGQILCNSHGATFRSDDGLCTAGPCKGSHLKVLPISVEDGVVFIDESATGSFFDV